MQKTLVFPEIVQYLLSRCYDVTAFLLQLRAESPSASVIDALGEQFCNNKSVHRCDTDICARFLPETIGKCGRAWVMMECRGT